jgi:hypothetical protein
MHGLAKSARCKLVLVAVAHVARMPFRVEARVHQLLHAERIEGE